MTAPADEPNAQTDDGKDDEVVAFESEHERSAFMEEDPEASAALKEECAIFEFASAEARRNFLEDRKMRSRNKPRGDGITQQGEKFQRALDASMEQLQRALDASMEAEPPVMANLPAPTFVESGDDSQAGMPAGSGGAAQKQARVQPGTAISAGVREWSAMDDIVMLAKGLTAIATNASSAAVSALPTEQPSRASEKEPCKEASGGKAGDKMKDGTGLKHVTPVVDPSKANEAPVKRKGGREPITNKSPWTKEVFCCHCIMQSESRASIRH